jgi:ABC-type oligopeptide transport system substrate-binding subunit/class 3 adenylate cyclase
MRCPLCDTDNREGARFCRKCAAELALVCPRCGAKLPLDAEFCDACAAPLVPGLRATAAVAPDAVAERLQRLVPREYAERLLATRGQVQPERRAVTILFSDLKGSTALAEDLDPEDALDIMSGALDVLIEPVYRHEGTLARVTGDAILAFFGAPIAHEDDPERACRAALEITAQAAQYGEKLERARGISGFNARVGIHSGPLVIGDVGSDLRVEYTAVGDAIELAARMQENAPPSGILITHDTYRHVRGVFDVLQQEPLTVKGKKEPVQTYLVQRAKRRVFRKGTRGVEGIETRMIGRETELNRLQDAFYKAMEDSELQMFTIVGDAGVGKSRLLHEFDIWAEARPQRYFFFKGRALQELQHLPYSLIRDLFAFRFQIEDTDPLAVVREKLEQGTSAALGDGENTRMRAHFIGHLVGFELGESSYLEGVIDDPRHFHGRALSYLAEYFRALSAQLPVLILLEDLHWADHSSLDALNHLAVALVDQPLMIVSAARPALLERRPQWGEGQPFHHTLQLEPLSRRNTRRLLDEILQKVDHIPNTLSEPVVAGAEGNPFFVEEVVKMLVEDGVIVKGEEQWHVDPSRLIDVRVPSTLRGVLQARLHRLPVLHRTILQQASVVGGLFWDLAIVRISQSAAEGLEEAEILNTLSALRGAEMVFQRQTSAFAQAQEYVFKHAVLREVTYDSLLESLRSLYHGLAADWLLEQGGERAGEYNGLIADHLEQAGRTAEATDYSLQAGDGARRLCAHQEAIHAYQRALALLKRQGDHERAARTLMKLGLTYHSALQFEDSRQAYEEGFRLWHQAGREQPAVPPPPAPHAFRLPSREPRTLAPTLALDTASIWAVLALFSGLAGYGSELYDIIPQMAVSWELLEGGRKYIFHLRDDVRWSDGVPVTAGDFEYAWKRVLDPAIGSHSAGLLHDIKGARDFHQGEVADPDRVGVQALDELTLVVELEGPAGYFLQLLAHPAALPVPRHVVQAHGAAWTEMANFVTSGRFRLLSWQRGESMVMVWDPEYHGRFTGNVQRVELSFVSDWSSALEMYEADRLDVLGLSMLPPAERDRARERHAGEYRSGPGRSTNYIAFDVSRPPFDDQRVRRALALAIDKEALAHVHLGGYSSPATGGFVPPGMPGHSPGIGLPYDPQQARQLLADAGYPGGRGFPDVDAVNLWDQALGQYIQTLWWENLGIEITWQTIDIGFGESQRAAGLPHTWIHRWGADYTDPDSFLRTCPVWFTSGWRNEAYERLVEQARRLMDHERRMDLYRRADRILVEEAPIAPLYHGRSHMLVKPWVKRYPGAWRDVVIEPH